MKRKRFSEEQIIAILNEDAGATAVEVCRRPGVSETTYYHWKAKFDDATRESPALLSEVSIARERVVRLLDELARRHGLPEEIVVDNGPEFSGRALFGADRRTAALHPAW